MALKRTLRSRVDTNFTIEVDQRVISSCAILQSLQENTKDDGVVDLNMSQKCLQKFVDLHNHFSPTDTGKDREWTNTFFREMPEADFKELCHQADFLDSQRFLEAAGDFVLDEFENMDVPGIQAYLNIDDDFTPAERQAMGSHPLEFFTNVNIENDKNDSVDAAPAPNAQENGHAAPPQEDGQA